MPKIDQLTHEQIALAMRQYKSGERSGTIMPQIAKGYTDEQIEIIAQVLGHD
jgi:cytochrome c553